MKFYAIVAIRFANGNICPHSGQYLESFDFEAYNGQGYGTFTYDQADALRFPSQAAAMAFWNTQSKTQPLRYDGRPNKPLTALSCIIEPLPEKILVPTH